MHHWYELSYCVILHFRNMVLMQKLRCCIIFPIVQCTLIQPCCIIVHCTIGHSMLYRLSMWYDELFVEESFIKIRPTSTLLMLLDISLFCLFVKIIFAVVFCVDMTLELFYLFSLVNASAELIQTLDMTVPFAALTHQALIHTGLTHCPLGDYN